MILTLLPCFFALWTYLCKPCELDLKLHSLGPESLHLIKAAYALLILLQVHFQDLSPLFQDHRLFLKTLLEVMWTLLPSIIVYALAVGFSVAVIFRFRPVVSSCHYFAQVYLFIPASIVASVNFQSPVWKASPTWIALLPKTEWVRIANIYLPCL